MVTTNMTNPQAPASGLSRKGLLAATLVLFIVGVPSLIVAKRAALHQQHRQKHEEERGRKGVASQFQSHGPAVIQHVPLVRLPPGQKHPFEEDAERHKLKEQQYRNTSSSGRPQAVQDPPDIPTPDDGIEIDKCELYMEEKLGVEGTADTGTISLTPRNYLNDPGCGHLGGWKFDDPLSHDVFIQKCEVDRIDINTVSDDYFESALRGRKPLLFVDPRKKMAFKHQRAYYELTRRSTMLKDTEEAYIGTARTAVKDAAGRGYDADPNAVGGGRNYSISDYIRHMNQPWRRGVDKVENSDYIIGNYDQHLPPAIEMRNEKAPFLCKSMMNSKHAPRIRLFVMGATGSGAAFHRHGTAWSHQIYGMKRWFLRPPHLKRALPPTSSSIRNTSVQWLFDKGPMGYAAMRAEEDAAQAAAGPGKRIPELVECVQMPGETFYLPPMWYHSTVNVAQSISVAQFDFDLEAGH